MSSLLVAILAAVAVAPSSASAAEMAATPADAPGSNLVVSLVTVGPGAAVEERFGHNAIWIKNQATGQGVAYNYGVFDFDQHNFILRFLQGRMDYWMEPWSPQGMIDAYRQRDRSVWVQELNLSHAQRLALVDYLGWNARPANREYRYDYYDDNCSTRVRGALDDVLGGQIERQLKQIQTGRTYRWHTQRLTADDPILYSALYFILGHKVDQQLTAWEESFLPVQLQKHMRNLTIEGESGRQVPLVAREYALYESRSFPEPEGVPRWGWAYLLIGLATGAAMAGLAWLAPRHRGWRLGLVIVAGGWVLLSAFMGTFMAGAWVLTSHDAVYYNENLFQFSLVAVPMMVLVPALALQRRRWARTTLVLAAAMVGLSALGLALKALPGFYQANGLMIALALPANAGLLLAVYLLKKRAETACEAGDATAQPQADADDRAGAGRTARKSGGRKQKGSR